MKKKNSIDKELILDTIAECSNDSLYFKDKDSKFIWVSKYLAECVGFDDPSHLIGKSDFDFFTREHAQKAYDDEKKVIETGQPITSQIETDVDSQGKTFWDNTSKYPFYDRKGNIIGTWGITRDYTAFMEMRKELERVNAELKEKIKIIEQNQQILLEKEKLASLGQMIGGIAHILLTPIMSVSGGLEAINDLTRECKASIDDDTVTKEDQHEICNDIFGWIQKIQTHCNYMSEAISTVKSQAMLLNESSNDEFTIDDLIKRVNIFTAHIVNKEGCHLKTGVEIDANTLLKGDITNIIQVLNNVIMNAVDAYEGAGGTIEFKICDKKNHVEFSIRDYGTGMSKKVGDRLFKNMVTTKGKKGKGMGLYLAYTTIKGRFGGEMRYESEKGKGTTFYITIPK